MYLENLVIDAADHGRLGRFWAALLGAEPITDTPETFEARLAPFGADGPFLDVCLSSVPEPRAPRPRLHLDLLGGPEQAALVERALGLGARHLDIGQHDVPWVVLADPEGNPFCVMEARDRYVRTGPVAALPLDCADPDRDADFWAALTGWVRDDSGHVPELRHRSGLGPLLELLPEPAPKPAGVKNRVHLDVRLEAGEDPDEAVALATRLGGREVDPGWGALPWRVLSDPSGNELCILPAREG